MSTSSDRSENQIRYPDITVQLTGQDGNIFAIMGAVTRAMRRAGVPQDKIGQFTADLTSSASYDEALRVVLRTVHVT